MTTPKLHTSLAEEKVRKAMASGAVHRIGIFPPWDGYEKVEGLTGFVSWPKADSPLPSPSSKSTCSSGTHLPEPIEKISQASVKHPEGTCYVP